MYEWLNGKTRRWEISCIPVLVKPYYYYDPVREQYVIDPKLSRELKILVEQALQVWKKASGGRFSFELIDQYKAGSIQISWRLPTHHRLGSCGTDLLDNKIIIGSRIDVSVPEILKPSDFSEIFNTILHELGHALGFGHAKQRHNVMHPYVSVGTLSQNVIDTLQWLYSHPAGSDYYSIGEQLGLGQRAFLFDVVAVLTNDKLKPSTLTEDFLPHRLSSQMELLELFGKQLVNKSHINLGVLNK